MLLPKSTLLTPQLWIAHIAEVLAAGCQAPARSGLGQTEADFFWTGCTICQINVKQLTQSPRNPSHSKINKKSPGPEGIITRAQSLLWLSVDAVRRKLWQR